MQDLSASKKSETMRHDVAPMFLALLVARFVFATPRLVSLQINVASSHQCRYAESVVVYGLHDRRR